MSSAEARSGQTAEHAVLAAVLLRNDLFASVRSRLRAEDFQFLPCRLVFSAMEQLWSVGRALDYITLTEELQRSGNLAAAGGRAAISRLADQGSSGHVDSYIECVLDASKRRQIVTAVNSGERLEEVVALASNETCGAETWGHPTPFTSHHLPPFPVDALPEWLSTFVTAEATATQTPPDLSALLSMAVCSAATARKVVVEMTPGYREPINLFVVVALPPANRKSAVFVDVAAPLADYEEREACRRAPEIAEATSRRRILEQRLQKAEVDAAKAPPDRQQAAMDDAVMLARELDRTAVGLAPRLLADDASPERLATLLRDHGGRMAVLAPEGDIFDLMAGKYSANNSPNFGVFLKGHAGDDLRIDRVNRGAEFVKKPALTIGLAVQPEVLRGLMDKPGFRGRGLLGRFLYAIPTSLIGHRDTDAPPLPSPIRETYERSVRALLDMPTSQDADGHPEPHILHPSPEARQRWREFSAWLEPQLAEDGDLGGLTDWAGKLAGAVVRLAGVLHLAEHATDRSPWSIPICIDTMSSAVRIATYLIPHARAAFAEMGADPVVEDAKHVLRWIVRKQVPTFTKRDAYQGTKGRFKRVDGLTSPLSVLMDHGFIRELELPPRPGRGRRTSPVFEANPHLQGNSGNCGNSGNQEKDLEEANSEVSPPVLAAGAASPAVLSGAAGCSHNSHNPQNSAPLDSKPAGANSDSRPAVACFACGQRRWRQTPAGQTVCLVCHPPATQCSEEPEPPVPPSSGGSGSSGAPEAPR
jgi:hypothetical protein